MSDVQQATCKTCKHWREEGRDGICFGGDAPQPRTLPKGEAYTVVWPRTLPEERCRGWEGDPN